VLWDLGKMGITATVGGSAASVSLPSDVRGADRRAEHGTVFLVIDVIRRN
jgi:hypothetical protein